MRFETRRYKLFPIFPVGPKVVVEGSTLFVHKWFGRPRKIPLDSLSAEGAWGGFSLRTPFNFIFGSGDLRLTGSAVGEGYLLTNVYKLKGLEEAVDGRFPDEQPTKSGSSDLFEPIESTPRSERLLGEAMQVSSFALVEDGRRVIVSEGRGDERCALATYDTRTEKLLEERLIARGHGHPRVLALVADPDRLVIDINDGLQVVDLANGASRGGVMRYKEPLWREPFDAVGRIWFRVGSVGVFDGGRLAVAHCGIAAPSMPSHLISWDLDRNQRLAGPVSTQARDASDDMAGVPDRVRRKFITGSRLGWVRWWDVDRLSMTNQCQIQTPPGIDRSTRTNSNNQIHALAISRSGQHVVAGTWSGAIHQLDGESGRQVGEPMIPSDFDYDERYEDFGAYNSPVTAMAFFDGDRKLIAGYRDSSVRIWDVALGREVGEPLRLGERVDNNSVDFLCVASEARKAVRGEFPEGGGATAKPIQLFDLTPYFR